ncbi:MAG TPA: hypothetical protein VFW28_11190 [Micropepsaceae bacterium]|nr:hypothetical protein [Micropepsaceae bacterium]
MDKPNPEYRPSNQVDRQVDAPVLTSIESRQGIMLGRVRWILGISLALVIIAFVSLYAAHFGSSANAPYRTGQVSASNTAGPNAVSPGGRS